MLVRTSLRLSYLPMAAKTIETVKATAPVVAPLASKITEDFYPRLLSKNPAAWAFFNKTNQKKGMQQQALADAVVAYASNIENLAPLLPAVAKISNRHCALGVTPDLYQMVHDTLMASIGEVLGDAVTPEIGEAWSNAVMALAEICINEEEKLYKAAEERKGGWRGYKDFELVKKEKVGEDTVAFNFAACDSPGTGIDFTHGQYLSIRVNEEKSGVISPRHYTVTSNPGDAFLQCTTRHVKGAQGGAPDGAVSTYMHTKMEVGDTVRLAPPFGVFTPDLVLGEDKNVAFVTAGIGITLAKAMSSAPSVNTIGTMHVDRSEDHTGCMADQLPGKVKARSYGQSHAAVKEQIAKFAVDVGRSSQYVLCGPIPFMKDAREALQDAGCSNIHFELFGTGSMK
mmetsp:Transcript_84193/g.160841  ORF Transcript_84193/g.160841 Transcript_84193/m.160841 type:complete len:398 (+) Transcript_84193:57-1250(+)